MGDSRLPLREPARLDRTSTASTGSPALFLAGEWQSTASGSAPGFALPFLMNELFEEFIGRSLRRAPPGRVALQHGGRHALSDASGNDLFALRPDAVIDAPTRTIIVDTKWKRLNPRQRDLEISSSGIYRMLAYARAYGAARAILLYPWSAEIGGRDGFLRRWKAANTNCRLDIATVDVGKPRDVIGALHRIVEFGGTGENALLRQPTSAAAASAMAPATRARSASSIV